MTKRLASKHKVDRRLKVNLWGRPKSPFNSRNYPPGQHGKSAKKGKTSDYGTQLEAKQKLKFYYGNMNERQFRNVFRKAFQKRRYQQTKRHICWRIWFLQGFMEPYREEIQVWRGK